jgi:hypothetical protein
MANRFASQQDYSQTFQYLVERNQQYLESAAQRVDAQREADWASKDNLIFTQYNEGKISPNELMAHISRRLRSSLTAEERNRWRALAVEYRNQIADNRAEAAYAESDNIGALIRHYAGRLANTAKGSPEYVQIAERLKGLRETRSRDNVTDGARRIIRKIETGKATKKDLMRFYQNAAKNAKGDLKQEILDNIAELRGQIRTETMEASITEIRTKLDGNLITPQQAANQYQAVLDKYNVANTDPADYATRRREIAAWRATPDELEIDRMEKGVIDGTVSVEEYTEFIDGWADKISVYDQAAAWELQQAADAFIQDNATPLEGGLLDRGNAEANQGSSTIQVARNVKGNALRYISQFDGSKYNGYNCGMAAGAMMAHAMGYPGLSGADLRALSGDTSGGTTVFQVAAALSNKQVGINAGDIEARSNWGFDEFIKRISQGSTAVLGGWTGAVSDTYNSTSGAMGHSIFIAGYDPEKGFLVMDPSGKGKQRKSWWPAEVIRAFAFSGQGWQGGFNGYAAVSPPNTVDPKTFDRAGSNAVVHVDVTAPPSGRVPGASPVNSATEPPPSARAQTVGEVLTDRERRRLRKAGIKPGKDLDTKQEVADLLENNESGISVIAGRVEEWVDLAEQGGMDEDGNIEMLDGTVVNADTVNVWQRQLIYMLDGQVILYDANGQKAEATDARTRRSRVLIDAAVVNTIDENRIENSVVRNAADVVIKLGEATSPQEITELTSELAETVDVLAAVQEQTRGDVPEDATKAEELATRVDEVVTGEEKSEQTLWTGLNEVLQNADQYETAEEFSEAMRDAAGPLLDDPDSPAGALAGTLIYNATNDKMVDTGEGTWLVVPGGTVVTVPLKDSGQVDEQGEPVMVPDLAVLGEEMAEHVSDAGINPNNLVPITMKGPGGEPVLVYGIPEVRQYKGVNLLQATDDDDDNVKAAIENLGLEQHTEFLTNNQPLNDEDIRQLDHDDIEALINIGVLTRVPFRAQAIEVDGKVYWRGQSVNPETGETDWSWHEDSLPYVPYQPESDDLTVPGGSYMGTDPNMPGLFWPAPVNDPDLMEDGGLGTDVLNFGLTPEESATFVQELQAEGVLDAEMSIPNPQNPSESIRVTATHPASPANTMPNAVSGFITKLNDLAVKVKDKIAQTMPAEEAADLDALTEFELRERARLAGVDFDTGEWIAGPMGSQPSEPPSEEFLRDLGIVLPAPPESEMETKYIDHLNEVKAKAAAERAERQKAEAAARKEAEEERKLALPTVEPKPSAGKLPTLPTPKAKTEPKLPTPKGPMPKTTPKPNVKKEPLGPPAPAPKSPLDITKPAPTAPKTVTPQPKKPEML